MTKVNSKKLVVVLGMHRSGTSATASLLELTGAWLGKKTTVKNQENPKGYFENQDIVDFNERLFAILGSRWDNALFDYEYSISILGPSERKKLAQEALTILKKNFDGFEVAGIKDPRMSLLLPFWQPVFKTYLGTTGVLYYLHVLRHPFEVAKSQLKRHQSMPGSHRLGGDLNETIALWFSSYFCAFNSLDIDNNLLVSFENVIYRPQEVVERLTAFLQLKVADSNKIENAGTRIDQRLHREKINETTLRALADRNPYPFQFYNVLLNQFNMKVFSRQDVFDKVIGLYPGFKVFFLLYAPFCLGLLALLNSEESLSFNEIQNQDQDNDPSALTVPKRKKSLYSILRSLEQKNSALEQINRDLEQKNIEWEEINKDLELKNNALEVKLNIVLQSRGWRVLLKLYAVKAVFIPPESRRQALFDMVIYFAKRPGLLFKVLSFRNIRLLFSKLRTGPPKEIAVKINAHLKGFDLQDQVYAPEIKKIDFPRPFEIQIPEFEFFDVSIIIPAYNQFEYNLECINSIVTNTYNVKYEIVFIDDVSTDRTSEIEKYVKNIKVIRNTENKGFLLNCNMGAERAKGKYLFFLNNDTYVTENWLQPLVEQLESEPDIGMVGSKLIYADGKLQEAGGIIWADGSGWNYGRGDNPSLSQYNYCKEVDYISGAAIMIRHDLWETIGGFDTRYIPAYYEDADLAFEVRNHGFKVVYNPKSEVIHYEGVSCGTDENSGVKAYQKTNREKFVNKHADILKRQCQGPSDLFVARDRSSSRKIIVVIDHYVPTYDKDAGSRHVFSCLKSFVRLGYSVKFIGDNFYNPEPYTSILQAMGIEVLYGNWYATNWKQWFLDNRESIKFVFINRPYVAAKYISFLKATLNVKIIYGVIDLHYKRMQIEARVKDSKEILNEAARMEKIERDVITKSDITFSVSQDEVDFINSEFEGADARWVPIFPCDAFCSKSSAVNFFPERSGVLFVGSYHHPPNKMAIDWFIQNVLHSLKETDPEIKFHIIGEDPNNSHRKLYGNNASVVLHGHVSDQRLSEIYNSVKLAVVPLQYGAGLKGKTLEAMSYGVPFVGTKYAIEGFPEKDRCFESYDSPEDFVSAILNLYQNESAWCKKKDFNTGYINKYFIGSMLDKVLSEAF